ncbi:DNA-directed RNA polymerase I core subunit Rpa12 [Malassezia pachydermatis]|uniref:DNA-directed RNA polymerase subunit n=1 Tax=Malassezia pachydermatis TaxID=77020 RepID=A0A0M8MM31_9BASI|nr:dna-directed rna polymerase complex i subunit rpa12 [Malassezia pachydermatis]KOS12867.1 dna-directed rna polymerase complex i subunit rpa12 [Malassezia pachydermatis]
MAGASSLVIPDKIGSLLFCSACGSLLDLPDNDDVITCTPCGSTQDARIYDNLSIVTRSHPSAFPSILRQKRQLVSNTGGDADMETMEQATIKEKCPGCGNEEMNFHTLQLRSADEGTTVFYDCPKCGYKFSQNN